MKKVRYLRIYDLHSWSGIILGLFVYIVSFTGCLALFDHELQTWEDPAKRLQVANTVQPMMSTFEHWVQTNAKQELVDFIVFSYPSIYKPYYEALMNTEDDSGGLTRHAIRWDTSKGQELTTKHGGLTEWLLGFHRDLMWPTTLGGRTAGRSLVGLVGIILMLSIITGIITHTKIIKEFFTLRVKRSVHLKWQDLHKVLGLWALPFYTMIAFTGAFLGIISILSQVIAVLAFKGDVDALISAVQGTQREPAGISSPMYSVDEVANRHFPGSNRKPDRILISDWGDKNSTYLVFYNPETELSSVDQLTVNGSTGELVKAKPSKKVSPANRVINAMSPLHYGNYGGIWLKFLYAILGVFLCVVTATGLMVWIERRLKSKQGRDNPTYYRGLGRLVIGVILGFPLASVTIFYLDKLYTGAESMRLFYTGIVYFSIVVFTILLSIIGKKEYRTVKHLFLTLSLATLGLPFLNWSTTGDRLIQGVSESQPWAWVDVTFLTAGTLLLLVSLFLPGKRAVDPNKKSQEIRPLLTKNAAL